MHDEPEPTDSRLGEDVAAIYHAQPRVPTAIDDAILNRARAHLARRSRQARRWWGAAAAAALAACVALVVWVNIPARVRSHAISLTGDVNHDGRVDIVDALLLARALEKNSDGRTWSEDVNHDGTVDRRDVDAIAMAAVKLETGNPVR